MKAALPQAELHIIDDSSHIAFYENPHDYYPVLLDFLGRQRQA